MSTTEEVQSHPFIPDEELEEVETKTQSIGFVNPRNHPKNEWFFHVVAAWINHPEILDSCVLLLKKPHVTRDELMDVLKIMHGLSRSTAQRRFQMMETLRIITEVKNTKNTIPNFKKKPRTTRLQKRFRLNPRLRKKFKHFLRFIDLTTTELTETKQITTYQGFNLLYQEIRSQ